MLAPFWRARRSAARPAVPAPIIATSLIISARTLSLCVRPSTAMQTGRGSSSASAAGAVDGGALDEEVAVAVRDGEEVRFRAFIDDITETVSPGYNENKYLQNYQP